MERIKELTRYQRGVLLILIAMAVAFTAVYAVLSPQKGIVYQEAFLERHVENETTVYAGQIKGEMVTFTVTDGKTLTFTYGDKTYGPYTVREDPTAVPRSNGRAGEMTGVEVREGEEILFRGGIIYLDGSMMLADEETGETRCDVSAAVYDSYGNMLGDVKPSVHTILRILSGPKLTRRVNWGAWFGGLFLSAVTAVAILFAEELFYLRMSFRVRNVDLTEPTDWELLIRKFSWTVLTVGALGIFISGLVI